MAIIFLNSSNHSHHSEIPTGLLLRRDSGSIPSATTNNPCHNNRETHHRHRRHENHASDTSSPLILTFCRKMKSTTAVTLFKLHVFSILFFLLILLSPQPAYSNKLPSSFSSSSSSTSSSSTPESSSLTSDSSSSTSSSPVKYRQLLHPSRVLYPNGMSADSDLPVCNPWSVCNKLDTYSVPWLEKQCTCPAGTICSNTLSENDGHTIVDKNRQFKVCEPIESLETCRYFRDVTWTLTSYPDNRTSQTIHCICPKNSVAYIFKHEGFESDDGGGTGYKYHFACSPESRLRCQRKEPCRLFTVRKRPDVEEVNTNTLCQCPRGSVCPAHHSESSVIPGTTYPLDHIKTYTGFCNAEYK